MKKIIRIASVIALACASLVYVGCTKDFSADIAKTNSDVSALKSKVDALDATVQTINSTVANLQTTKADLSVVNALEASLNGKIDGLTADLEEAKADIKAASDAAAAAQLTAEGAQKAAEQAAADLKAAKAELDTIIAGVNEKIETLEVNTDSLRKDVDSLYKNSVDFENRIAALEGKVADIAARVTSIVAMPSATREIRAYEIDTTGNAIKDTLFIGQFAISPKNAEVKAEDFKLVLKSGLTRDEYLKCDTTCKVSLAKNTDGIVTIIAKTALPTAVENNKATYFSLVYNGSDKAGAYAVQSEFTKANIRTLSNPVKLENLITVVKAGKPAETKANIDTISYAETADTVFSTIFNGCGYEVVANFNDEYISLNDFAKVFGTAASKLAIDTTITVKDSILHVADSYAECKDFSGSSNENWHTSMTDYAFWREKGLGTAANPNNVNGIKQIKKGVFAKAGKTSAEYYGNRTTVDYVVNVGNAHTPVLTNVVLSDTLYIGARNLGTFDLGKTSEEWYYDYAKNGITATYTIINKKVADVLKDTLKSGKFSVSPKIIGTSVNVDVNKVAYAKVGADTTYNVTWTTSSNLKSKLDTAVYSIAWAYKVGPRPADPEAIKFAAADTIIGKKAIEVEFEGVYEASIAAIDELDNRSVIDAPKAVSVDGVKVTEKTFKGPNVTFSWTDKKTIVAKFDKAEAGKTYVIVAEADCAGITFTYEFTVTVVSAATPKLKALSAYVKEEGGKYSIEIAAPEPSKARYANRNYVANLNEVVFSHYFVIDTTDAKLANLKVDFADLDTTSTRVLGLHSVTAKDYVEFNDTPSEWAPYDSTVANVVAYLITNAKDTIDNVAIKFWTKEPIKSVAHVDSTVKHNNAKGDKINLDRLFTMKDYLDSTVWKNGAEVTGRGYYDYDIEIEYLNDTTWTITGGTLPKGAVHMDADAKTLVLEAQSAEIVNPVTVEIPFVVKHCLDKFGKAADDRQGTVKVTFTSAE